ncbi:MAG: DUF5666 domain-containing protein, partial [Pseudomonadota bacterium]
LALALAAAAAAWAAIDRGGVARGVLTDADLGNPPIINVAGVDYDISQAQVQVDGIAGSGDDLRLGQVLDVTDIVFPEGWPDTDKLPTAGGVSFEDVVQGPIDNIVTTSPGTGVISVLGQRVSIDVDTVIDASLADFDSLRVGQRVEVSGYPSLPGEVIATRVSPAPAGAFELTGEIRVVTANVILIGSQIVFVGLTELSGFDGGNPQVGDWVQAQGVLRGSLLLARSVERRTRGLTGEAKQEIEVEGVIVSIDALDAFQVDGTPVITTADTQYIDGTSADVTRGRLVEVEGELDDGGTVITARSIDFNDTP